LVQLKLRFLNHDDCALSDALAQEERGVWQGGAWQHEWSLGWQATVISISGWPLCPDTPQGRGGGDRGHLGDRHGWQGRQPPWVACLPTGAAV